MNYRKIWCVLTFLLMCFSNLFSQAISKNKLDSSSNQHDLLIWLNRNLIRVRDYNDLINSEKIANTHQLENYIKQNRNKINISHVWVMYFRKANMDTLNAIKKILSENKIMKPLIGLSNGSMDPENYDSIDSMPKLINRLDSNARIANKNQQKS